MDGITSADMDVALKGVNRFLKDSSKIRATKGSGGCGWFLEGSDNRTLSRLMTKKEVYNALDAMENVLMHCDLLDRVLISQ